MPLLTADPVKFSTHFSITFNFGKPINGNALLFEIQYQMYSYLFFKKNIQKLGSVNRKSAESFYVVISNKNILIHIL